MGKLIVIEGGDGVGKETQSKLLVERLRTQGPVELISFPDYERETGKLIKRILYDKSLKPAELSPYLMAAPFALDRAVARPRLEQLLKDHTLIANRYVTTNFGYQGAKLTGPERDEFIRVQENIEYDDVGLPRPSLVIVLDMPSEVSRRLLEERAVQAGRALDELEENINYQIKVADVFRELTEKRADWKLVSCAPGGKLRSREEIAQDIYQLAATVLSPVAAASTI